MVRSICRYNFIESKRSLLCRQDALQGKAVNAPTQHLLLVSSDMN